MVYGEADDAHAAVPKAVDQVDQIGVHAAHPRTMIRKRHQHDDVRFYVRGRQRTAGGRGQPGEGGHRIADVITAL